VDDASDNRNVTGFRGHLLDFEWYTGYGVENPLATGGKCGVEGRPNKCLICIEVMGGWCIRLHGDTTVDFLVLVNELETGGISGVIRGRTSHPRGEFENPGYEAGRCHGCVVSA
jgi:hypothetical protein